MSYDVCCNQRQVMDNCESAVCDTTMNAILYWMFLYLLAPPAELQTFNVAKGREVPNRM